MKRERLRTDFPQLVFSYWARPIQEKMPDWYWTRIFKQDQAWNSLVAHRNGILEQTKDITDKSERKIFWVDFLQNCRALLKEHHLDWESEGELFDRFMTAHTAAMKKGLRLRMRFADRRDRLLLTHRFTGGGMPYKELYANGTSNDLANYHNWAIEHVKTIRKQASREQFWDHFIAKSIATIEGSALAHEEQVKLKQSFLLSHQVARDKDKALVPKGGWRISLNPVYPFAYQDQSQANRRKRRTTGVFGLSKFQKIEFATHINRQIPQEAIVKKVYWSGKFMGIPPEAPMRKTRNLPSDGWEYSIQFVCEIPPYNIHREDRGVCGVDLGWRSMNDRSYVRIGMISDSAGRHFEIRFPLNRRDSRAKRGLRKHLKGQDVVYDSYLALTDLSSMIGNRIEVLKGELRESLDSEWITQGFTKMRQGGLNRMLMEMIETHYTGPARTALEEWKKSNDRLEWTLNRQMRRLIGYRRHIYLNLSAWLTKNYRIVSWEGDLSLKEMAESASESPILANAAKFRQWACLSELRSDIKGGSKKNCNILHPAKAAGTTGTCYQCGGKITTDSIVLRIECENGHAWDQDHNASMNLLGDGFHYGLEQGILKEEDAGAFFPLEIPSQLQGIVVPVVSGQ